MVELRRVAPIFPVRNVQAALRHSAQLGFAARGYSGGGYGFATRDGVELHLGETTRTQGPASAYIWVDDADAVAGEWRAAGVEVHPPVDTEWGQHEGAEVDPDGNVIRFGSPIRPT